MSTRVIAVICLTIAAITLSSSPVCCAPVRDGDPGTIGACLTQPDGTQITLPCEQIIGQARVASRSRSRKALSHIQPDRASSSSVLIRFQFNGSGR